MKKCKNELSSFYFAFIPKKAYNLKIRVFCVLSKNLFIYLTKQKIKNHCCCLDGSTYVNEEHEANQESPLDQCETDRFFTGLYPTE